MIKVAIGDTPPWSPAHSNPEIDRLNNINATLYRQNVELLDVAKQLKAERDALQAENAQLRAQAPVHNSADDGVWIKKWRQMETLFARNFHPDAPAKDASVREQIFKQFWDELRKIRNAK